MAATELHEDADCIDTDLAVSDSAPPTFAVAAPVCAISKLEPLTEIFCDCTSIVVLDISTAAIFIVADAAVVVKLSADIAKLPATATSALPISIPTVVAAACRVVVARSTFVPAVTFRVSASITVPSVDSSKLLADVMAT